MNFYQQVNDLTLMNGLRFSQQWRFIS